MFLISLPFWVESHKNFICLNSSAILINKNNWQVVRDGTLRFRKLKVCRTPRFRKFKIDSVGSSMQYLIQKYFLFIKITGAIYIEWDIYTCNFFSRILGQNTLNSVSCTNYATMYVFSLWLTPYSLSTGNTADSLSFRDFTRFCAFKVIRYLIYYYLWRVGLGWTGSISRTFG